MRATFCAASLIVALAALVGAGRLWAEDKEEKKAAKAAPRTRIAVLNLTYVIKNYKKYSQFQDEMKKLVTTYQERDKKLRARGEKLAKEKGNSPIIPAKSDDVDEKLKKIQREIEDNNVKAKKAVGKKTDDEMKIIYMDLVAAAQGYATAHDFEMVLHYNDAVTKEDYFSTPNIARKLQLGALMPLYAAPGIDISQEVVAVLNAKQDKEDD